MRPVNLIPAEDRRGDSAPTRAGGLAYVVVAVLAVGLAVVCAMVFLGKQISDREAEVATLEARSAETQARAESLSSFVSFQDLRDARVLTVDQLAKSRFDWERTLRELSRVLPKHIWLTSLVGSVAPGVGESVSPLRAEVPGPALELAGCGGTHRDVARLIAAMKDIDGVTRVTATDSMKSDMPVAAPIAGTGDEPVTGDDCQTRSTIPKFNLIAAFDEVAVPLSTGEAAPVTPPVTTPEATPTSTSSGSVPETEAQSAEGRNEVADADRRTQNAANLVPGAER